MPGNRDTTFESSRSASDKRAAADHKTLQRLRQSCRITLERYIDLAGQRSGHLATLTPGAFDPVIRVSLAVLKQKEDRAHEVYLKAREALLAHVMGEAETGNPV